MKKTFLLLGAVTMLLSACSWTMNNSETIDATLPVTTTPSEMVGNWINGFANSTQVIDVYNGQVLGHTWSSGKYFKITPDGKSCEFYLLFKSQYSTAATKATGTIRFDNESTNSRGTFTFLPLSAHYKGWGSVNVNREATPAELKTLSGKYHYRMDGEWLRIEPKGEPTDNSSSFRKVSEP